MNIHLVFYILKAALRDRLLLSCLGLVGLTVALALFVGGSAIIEKREFITVYAAGGIRVLMTAAMVLFISFFVQRCFDNRDVEYLLSRPLTRVSYVLSHVGAILVLAVVGAALGGGALMGINPALDAGYAGIWVVSLAVELMMLGSMALFVAMVLPSATATALVVLGFYVLGRMMGQLFGIMEGGIEMPGATVLAGILKVISMVLPRLDLMTQTSWLIYGPQGTGGEGLLFIFAQGGVFLFLCVTAAVVDLLRRQF